LLKILNTILCCLRYFTMFAIKKNHELIKFYGPCNVCCAKKNEKLIPVNFCSFVHLRRTYEKRQDLDILI